jgi:hypothetical protein
MPFRSLRPGLAVLLATVLTANTVSALGTITVTPAAPTPADPIHIVVAEGFVGGICWTVDSRTCTFVAPDSVIVTANIQFCNGSPLGCFCTAQPVDFEVTCDFPPLPNGTYKAVYRERYLNPIDDRNQAPYSVTFTVAGPTPVLRRSWGKLKAHYR